MPIQRRRSSRDDEAAAPEETQERPTRPSRARSTASEETEERPTRPARRSGGGTRGFAAYSQKKQSTSSYADEFKPEPNTPVLIRFLEEGPFDTYNQHWVEEGNAAGKTRHSFVCRKDDEYFSDDNGCPLCDVGESRSTYSLFNVLDLTNPRKPEVKVWRASPAVTDKLERASRDKKTSPLNREDVYFEVEMVKSAKKTTWELKPVKSRDLQEDFDMEPLDASELDSFSEKLFDDRTAVTKVDSYDDLQELADSLD